MMRSEIRNGCLVFNQPLEVRSDDGKIRVREAVTESDYPKRFIFDCPGCRRQHAYTVGAKEKFGADYHLWDWNGSVSTPTFFPSMICRFGDGEICHFFVTDGEIAFCGDSTHALSGKTVKLAEISERG